MRCLIVLDLTELTKIMHTYMFIMIENINLLYCVCQFPLFVVSFLLYFQPIVDLING